MQACRHWAAGAGRPARRVGKRMESRARGRRARRTASHRGGILRTRPCRARRAGCAKSSAHAPAHRPQRRRTRAEPRCRRHDTCRAPMRRGVAHARSRARKRKPGPVGIARAAREATLTAAESPSLHVTSQPASPKQGMKAPWSWRPAARAAPASKRPGSIGSGAAPRSNVQANTAPGFMTPRGSSADLIERIAASFAGSE